MPDPLTDVRQISHVAYGFFASKALFGALNVELFKHLAPGPRSVAALAGATGVAENRLATLLAALASTGLVTQEGGHWANSPAAARYLVPGEPAYFGDYYRYQIDRQLYPNMLALDAGLAGDDAALAHASMSSMLEDPAEAEAFSRAQHAGSMGPAMLMAKTLDFAGVETMLDVAGGTGAYSIVLCRQYPDMAATIIDFPTVTDVARGYVEEAGMADRIRLLPGDALEVDWPGAQDAVLMSYLLSAVGEAEIPPLVDRARAALKPGGLVVVHDFMLDPQRSGPFAAAGFFLSYLALRTDPVSFTAEDSADWLRAAGFVDIETGVMIPEITGYAIGRAPA